MIRFLQIIFIVILFRYLWRMMKKYWPSVSDVNESSKTNSKSNKPKFKVDKSDIEDAEFTEIDDEK